jgi:hypothetical protein
MHNYLFYDGIFPVLLGLFRPPGSGFKRPSNSDPEHCTLIVKLSECFPYIRRQSAVYAQNLQWELGLNRLITAISK